MNAIVTVAKIIGVLVGYILVSIASIVAAGILIMFAWDWFIVPASGAREIHFSEGVGLYIVVGILIQFGSVTHLNFSDIPDSNFLHWVWLVLQRFAKLSVLYPFFSLLLAWVWHTYFM